MTRQRVFKDLKLQVGQIKEKKMAKLIYYNFSNQVFIKVKTIKSFRLKN